MATGQAAEQAKQTRNGSSNAGDEDRGAGSVAGNLTADPDLRFTSTGRPVTNIRIAHNSRVQNGRTGEWEDGPTAFYDITCWGTLAENVAEVLQRGDRIVAEGRWLARKWVDKDEQEHEVVYLSARDLGPSMMFRVARPHRPQRGDR